MTQCPKCYIENRKKADAMRPEVRAAYGTVSQEEFTRMVEQAASFRKAICNDPSFTESLKENWNLCLLGTVFEVDYSAHCENCGFEFEFHHAEDVLKPKDTPSR